MLQKNPGISAAKVEHTVNLTGAKCTASVVGAENQEHPTKRKEVFTVSIELLSYLTVIAIYCRSQTGNS
jgi:hypothetical protein